MDAKPDNTTRKLVHHDQDPTGSQGGGFTSEQIAVHKLSLAWRRKDFDIERLWSRFLHADRPLE